MSFFYVCERRAFFMKGEVHEFFVVVLFARDVRFPYWVKYMSLFSLCERLTFSMTNM